MERGIFFSTIHGKRCWYPCHSSTFRRTISAGKREASSSVWSIFTLASSLGLSAARVLAFSISQWWPPPAYQCSAMMSKLPMQLFRKLPSQSESVPYRGPRFPTYLARDSGGTLSFCSIRPDAIRVMDGSAWRIALANSLCFIMKYFVSVRPSCHAPQGSLPIFQNLTWYGSGWPFFARFAPMYVVTDPFMYSTSSAAECESPKPALRSEEHTSELQSL